MMTKQQEREALQRIKNILADAGKDSYIGMAFEGCVEDAESNIENDWALSMAQRWQSADGKRKELEARLKYALQENKELQGTMDRGTAMIESLKQTVIESSNRLIETRSALDDAIHRAESAEAEIIRLKAKLYDFMTAEKDCANG